MRFLFTSIPGFGHFHPVLPLARALKDAGHDVAVATAPAFGETIRAAGLDAIPAGLDWDESRLIETLPAVSAIAKEYQGDWMMKTIFLDRSPRMMISDLSAIIPSWRPDAILSGTYEFGGALAAERHGLPYASCSISFRWNKWVLQRVVGKPVARLRSDLDLPPDPQFSAFGRYLDLCFVPPAWTLTGALLQPYLTRLVFKKVFGAGTSWRQRMVGAKALLLQGLLALDRRLSAGQDETAPNTHFIQRFPASNEDAPPAWFRALPAQPTIYVSLGTVFSTQYADLFAQIVAALRDEPVNLIVTTGSAFDPARLGPQPANVRVERFIAPDILRTLLPHIDLCLCHSGYATVMEALSCGLPLVLLPLAADQPVITQMCLANGLTPDLPPAAWRMNGKGLPIIAPERLTAKMIRDAARKALDDPRYRAAARRMQADLAALPGLDRAVQLVEQIARKP